MKGQQIKEVPVSTESLERAWELHKQFEDEILARYPDLTPELRGEPKGNTASEVEVLERLRADILETLFFHQYSLDPEVGLKVKYLSEAYVLLKGVVEG